MKNKTATTTYYIERAGGLDQKVTVPSHWKVTFGPLNPGSKGGEASTPALRFYESPNQQRMVITNVKCFRDMGIQVEEKRVSVKRQAAWKDTPHGRKDFVVEGKMEQWVNPDAPSEDGQDESFALLPPVD